jgi:effector-binding domain-containing protein
MIETPEIIRTESRPTALIHLTVPREEIRNVMGPGLDEVKAAVAAQGVAAEGPWFTHHLTFDPQTFDFEIHVPVTAPVQAEGRVKPGEWPAMKVARAVYRGRYDWLPTAWVEFNAWVSAEGLKPAPDLWEVYASGPDASPDPAAWRTELYRPLVE